MPPASGGRDPRLWWFAGAAGSVLVIGVVLVLALAFSGSGPFREMPAAPTDVRPPLARLCPPSTEPPSVEPPSVEPPSAGAPRTVEPVPAGRRTVDRDAGISYRAYGEPWLPWNTVWSAGTLNVPYRVGQHFVTESAYDGFSDYHASILSAAVPAAENDALTFNLECVGRQVAADVRAEYYPQPTRMELRRDERATLGGRPAWVTVFRLHFSRPGLRATDELAAVACIDVGKPTAAVLYVSIPGTHRRLDWIVDDVLASVRPA
ncbi:hypothetical protein SAMN05444365_101273 [Micromonospora pattaloongensis]|uniref:Uncharacterized protein n=1 Tax=Micromonospora pattaloongensis TaxID=405436 RepID=A0A1H3G3U1_9ACTN|nr:hypothetical protein [Micromonospora pattaloongensis]SDX97916.1 hypothetical protein SAMN05444365_101273 [Micromonospora pattaloongensis]